MEDLVSWVGMGKILRHLAVIPLLNRFLVSNIFHKCLMPLQMNKKLRVEAFAYTPLGYLALFH